MASNSLPSHCPVTGQIQTQMLANSQKGPRWQVLSLAWYVELCRHQDLSSRADLWPCVYPRHHRLLNLHCCLSNLHSRLGYLPKPTCTLQLLGTSFPECVVLFMDRYFILVQARCHSSPRVNSVKKAEWVSAPGPSLVEVFSPWGVIFPCNTLYKFNRNC